MNKDIITKEYFNEIMESVKNTYKYQEGLNDYFSKNGVDGYIYQPDCVDTTMKLLQPMLERYITLNRFVVKWNIFVEKVSKAVM